MEDAVVVMTGASSGIGRAAAVEFARCGSRLVLAARRGEDLERTARLCREVGGDALVVVTDVTREADVQHLARAATEAYGGIDVWINDAGVTLFARLSEAPFDEHKRVIETNLFGSMLGARAALPRFLAQGHGVLVNVGSLLSEVGQPFVPSYVVSKFALRGLSEALRTEVAEHRDVHVCTLLPYAVDTPHFEEAANVRERRARPMPPTQSPEKVARALVDLAARPRRELHVPHVAALGPVAHWMFPRTTERLLLRALSRWHFDDHREPATHGNLHAPGRSGGGAVHGTYGAQIGTPAFAAWALRELLGMAVEGTSLFAPPRARRALFEYVPLQV